MTNKNMTKKNESPTPLSDTLREHLGVYALAATAAGVGMPLSAQSAEAKIIYTPAHQKVVSTLPLDLNHDGIVDFNLTTQLIYGRGDRCSVVAVPETSQNKIWGNELLKLKGIPNTTFIGAPDFKAGFVVDSQGAAGQRAGAKVMVKLESVIGTGNGTYRSITGAWANHGAGVTNRFLAFAFTIEGKTHFGWARMDTGGFGACSARLTGYAYETVAGKAIQTGQTSDDVADESANLLTPDNNGSPKPANLGALSLGWSGLEIWRRPEEIS